MANTEAIEVITASKHIPYSLLKQEAKGLASDFMKEMQEILNYYDVYEKGAEFTTEGTKGDYAASNVRFKKSAQLINKEARFLFGETPDVVVEPKGEIGQQTERELNALTVQQSLIRAVMEENNFEDILLKAAKDCFIGKRVACFVNFSEVSGITIEFLDAMRFVYEYDDADRKKLTKLVGFSELNDSSQLTYKRILKKKYELVDGVVYAEEIIYDGRGKEIEVQMPYQATLLTRIPGAVFLNDGLLSTAKGESEIAKLTHFESLFSKMNNADVDAERKGMNQIKYTIDMDVESTKNLSSSPGSYWDLQSNQDIENASPSIGTLSSSMEYSAALGSTLKRIRGEMFEELEIPDITLENMAGVITSGKALKAIYWPLIVRCKEKMKMWGPRLSYIFSVIIEGASVYKDVAKRYTEVPVIPISSEVKIVQNFPLPEDEQEEKNMDLAEVAAQTMSRKTYMKKWRELTDDEADAELEQIAIERQMLEDSFSDFASANNAVDEETEIEAEKELMQENNAQ